MGYVNAEILRAIADGKKVQYHHTWSDNDETHYGLWKDFDGKDLEACWCLLTGVTTIKWRIASKAFMIGEHEVPEPFREALRSGQKFWTVNPFAGPQHFTWDGSKEDCHVLNCGFVHLTKEAAEAHYEAFKSLLAK